MPQSEAGPSAVASANAADPSQKVRTQQTNKAQQQDKAVDNRAKAQQNKERAAQNRAQKAQKVSFAEDGAIAASSADGAQPSKPTNTTSTSDNLAKQPKKQPKKDAPKAQTPRPGQASSSFKSKVVIRRLPPNLPEEIFWKAVSPWIRDANDSQALDASAAAHTPAQAGSETTSSTPKASTAATVDFKKFVAGKLKTDANKQNKHARAYVRFLDPQSLVQFHKAFDGHIFRDSKGKETVAIVEFAPYQKVVLPQVASGQRGRKAKPDPKQGTIEKDADYQSFLERLNNAGDDVKRSEGDLLASLHDPKGKEKEKEAKLAAGKATPLLLHLRAVKMAKLESAAAIKKAKKMEKAKAKAAAAGKTSGAVKGDAGDAAGTSAAARAEEKAKAKKKKKKEKAKAKEKARVASAAGDGVKTEQGGAQEKPTKKEKSKKRKGKAAVAAETPPEPVQGATAKQPSTSKVSKKLDTKPVAADATSKPSDAQGGGESKAKAKNKPPRKKGAAKDKEKSATTSNTSAPVQPANVQILKRE
ncbi:Smg4_UPF3 domain-containing protein [Pseudozyma hubeiensis]|nr:Smg4_UPF3 domain-containing protein [Pseudozyma hubeiensis]